jgi:LEA14-like dessication related protein
MINCGGLSFRPINRRLRHFTNSSDLSINYPQRKRNGISSLKILAVIFTVLIISGALVGYSYTQITTNVSSVEFTGLTFSEPGPATLVNLAVGNQIGAVLSLLDSLVLQVNIDVGNGGFIPVVVPSIEFDFSINGIPAGSGRSDSSYTISPRQLQAIPVRVDIPAASLQPMIDSIVSSLGELDVEIRGKVNANLIGIPIDIPFETTEHISLSQAAEEKARAWLSRVSGEQGDIPTDFSIESVKWIVDGREVMTANPGSTVTAVMMIKAEERFGYTIALEVRQDRAMLPDVSFGTRSYPFVMQPGETEELSFTFRAEGGLTVKGYFMSLRWTGHQWQMPAEYPPRLSSEKSEGSITGSIIVVDSFWSLGVSRVTSVRDGNQVTANIVVKANGAFDGVVTVEVRQDLIGLPDESVTSRQFDVKLSSGQEQTVSVAFTAQSEGGSRGYFVQLFWDDDSWTMPSSYPPRLIVEGAVPPPAQGRLQIVDAFWTVSSTRVNKASDKMIVVAHLLVRAEGGSFTGGVTLDVRQDNIASPDTTVTSNVFSISLSNGELKELILTFTAESHFYSRGYFIRIFWQSDSWEMEGSYPPRLSV